MKSIRLLLIRSFTALGIASIGLAADHSGHHTKAAELTKNQTTFLANYEGIRAALAADDLGAAKRSAAKLTASKTAAQLSKASSLDSARATFKKLSAEAVQIAKGHAGYYVANCPMAGADWVQTNKQISNPYYGKSMLTCGSIKE